MTLCHQCGKEIQSNSEYCMHCGSYITSSYPLKPNRPSEATVAGVLLFIIGLAWMGLGLVWGVLLGFMSLEMGGAIFLIGAVVGVIAWLFAAGILLLKKWSYTPALILAAISLLNFPIGTLFGALSVWMLSKKDVKEVYLVKSMQ